MFIITLSNKKRCRANSKQEDWTDRDYSEIMNKLREQITTEAHKSNMDHHSLSTELIMTQSLPWENAWLVLEKTVLEMKLDASRKSLEMKNRITDRNDATNEKEWSVGSEYTNRQLKFYAKNKVLKELELATGKETAKAESVLSAIVSGLALETGFNELSVLSEPTRKRMSTLESTISGAGKIISGLSRSVNLGAAKVLTAVTAVLLPANVSGKSDDFYIRDVCEMLHINRKSKYFLKGIQNRKQYDAYLMLEGDIRIGEKVSCRSSPEALVKTIGQNGSVTVQLLPFETEKTFPSFSSGKIRRYEPSLDNYYRATRFDTTPTHIKTTIEEFFRRHVPISPNKSDIVKRRHQKYKAQFETRQAMLRYQTMNELWHQFIEDHPEMATGMQNVKQPNTAPMIFRCNAPWEMRKANDSGCLCKDCESFHLLRRGVLGACVAIDKVLERLEVSVVGSTDVGRMHAYLTVIKDVIGTPSKYDTIVKCLKPCLNSDKLEHASSVCLNKKVCVKCGFRQWWSNGLKQFLFNDDLTINDDSTLAGEEWTQPDIDWRCFSSVATPTVASHAEEVSNNDQGGDDYQPIQMNSRTLCQATKRGTLVDFLDEFENQSEKHAYHRNLVSAERRAQILYERNVRPLIVKRDIDFSENGTLKDKRQIQSQYWVTIGYSLFVSIASWLMASVWNMTTGTLSMGDEVTVDGEMSGEEINAASFWAVVTDVSEAEKDVYEVTDSEGKIHVVHRPRLRLRSRHSVATGHVTDDKVHDRHAMQHFTNHELKYLETYMKEHYPDDIPKGSISRLHQHSDNASHFKSTGAIAYFTTLINERGGPTETAFVYSFGAPGHGKGPYDGIGGRWKNKIDQAMSTAERKSLEFLETGKIQNVKDVYVALEYYFGKSTKKDAQLAGKNPIHHYKFFCYMVDENPIQRPVEAFDTLDGITKRYQIVVKTEGCIYWRKRSCWCLTCMGSLFQGSLEWGNNHDSDGCDLVTETLVGSESMYCFEKKICQKTAGPGVAVQSQSLTRDRNEMAARLTVGDFVLFKQSDDDIEPIWLGRIMSNPEWQGQGVYHNKSRRNITFDGTPVGRGEVALYVMWYEKIDVTSERLDYWVSRSETVPIVQNNRYYVPIDVNMHQMLEQSNVVPRLRTSTRGDTVRSANNNQKRIEDWHNKELQIVWNMEPELRRLALA